MSTATRIASTETDLHLVPTGAEDERRRSMDVFALEDLHVDPVYQRTLRSEKVDKIIKRFDPMLLMPLVVNVRDDDRAWVIDGQHRLEVLRRIAARQGIEHPTVNTITYWGLTQAQEAWLFAQLNKAAIRSVLTPQQAFKGELAAGDPAAQEILEAVESAGYVLRLDQASTQDGNIAAIGALTHLRRQYGMDNMRATLRLMASTWGTETGAPAEALKAVGRFVSMYEGEYDANRFIAKFQKVDLDVLHQQVRYMAAQAGIKTYVAWNLKLVELYNKGAREKSRLANEIERRAAMIAEGGRDGK